MGASEQARHELTRQVTNFRSRVAINLPRTAKGVLHVIAGSGYSLCGAGSIELVHDLSCASDDVLLRRDLRSGKESNDPAESECTFARRLSLDDRLSNVRLLEPDQEVDARKRGPADVAAPMT